MPNEQAEYNWNTPATRDAPGAQYIPLPNRELISDKFHILHQNGAGEWEERGECCLFSRLDILCSDGMRRIEACISHYKTIQ